MREGEEITARASSDDDDDIVVGLRRNEGEDSAFRLMRLADGERKQRPGRFSLMICFHLSLSALLSRPGLVALIGFWLCGGSKVGLRRCLIRSGSNQSIGSLGQGTEILVITRL